MKAFSTLLLLAAPSASMAQVPAPTPGYVHSVLGAATCPFGSEPMAEVTQCEDATDAMSYNFMYTVSWDSNPTGCFCLRNDGNRKMCYYNTHEDGNSNSGVFVACAASAPAGYKFSTLGSATCPDQSSPLTTPAECGAAAAASDRLAPDDYDYDYGVRLAVNEWRQQNWAPGCSYSTSTGLFNFNSNWDSTPNPYMFVVCMAVPVDPAGYRLSRLDQAECPAGSSPLDAAGCEEAATAMSYDYVGAPSSANRPPGCNCRRSDAYSVCTYNEHQTGAPNPDFVVACAVPTPSPSNSPTGSPTATPTSSPTRTPTSAPTTSSPTASPTSAGPWIAEHVGTKANFSSNGEVALEYHVGAGRDVRVELHKKGCAAPVDTALYETTNVTAPLNASYQDLVVTHAFALAELAGSEIWNSSSDTLQVCQKLVLFVGDMDIIEDVREIEVAFDMQADFDTLVDLAPETIEEATENVDFQNDVEAYKCAGGDGDGAFTEDAASLAPNQELVVCLKSLNVNVKLDKVTRMTIVQDAAPVQVVDGGDIVVEAITEVDYDVSPGNIMVTTRVPIDRFSFETGKNITISGEVELEFTNGRRLRALAGDANAAAEDPGEAGYSVTVNLKSEADGVEETQAPIGASDGYVINGKGVGALFSVVFVVMSLVM